jgi:RNA polymerase sigma-70 factor (ECF subfamily)
LLQTTENDDALLVRRCLRGEDAAFAVLVQRHQKAVFNLALRMLKDYQEAQEITQEVFIKAYEKLDTFDERFKFFSWIYRMAVNAALNRAKRRRRFDALAEDSDYASASPNPHEDYEESETDENVQRALMLLKPDYRAVLVLKHFEGLSYEEIGEALGIPEKTVKSRLFTARQMLKDVLLKQGYRFHD